MRNILKVLLFFIFSVTAHVSYATQAPWELQAVSVSDTSIQIDWEDVTDVLWYYIYYWESSGIWSEYDIEWIDLLEESNYELTDLQPDTTYYIAITAVDETWSESEKSPELESATLSEWEEQQISNLRLVQVEVIDETSIAMQFSVPMETGTNASRQFIMENVDTGEELSVDISDVIPGEPTNILAILWSPMTPSSEYKITVLDIRDTNGNTIESWIDAFLNFTTPDEFNMILESAWEENEDDNTIIVNNGPITNEDLVPNTDIPDYVTITNSSETEEENGTDFVDENIDVEYAQSLGNNAGTTISSDDLSDNTLNTAAENDKLPQTGPEHWILILVAVMLWTWIFYKIRK